MILVDDRTQEQKKTHRGIVLMTDRFSPNVKLTYWGWVKGGPSYAGWAFSEGNESGAYAQIKARSDAKNVRVVYGDYRPPAGPGHCHIYIWSSAWEKRQAEIALLPTIDTID
jgi:hypothetical protein